MTADRDGKEDVQSVAALLAELDEIQKKIDEAPYRLAEAAWALEMGGKLRNAYPILRVALASLAEGGAEHTAAPVVEWPEEPTQEMTIAGTMACPAVLNRNGPTCAEASTLIYKAMRAAHVRAAAGGKKP